MVYLLLQPYLPWAVRTVALSGIAGFTLLISLVSDLLSLLTLHISIFYTISARCCHIRRFPSAERGGGLIIVSQEF